MHSKKWEEVKQVVESLAIRVEDAGIRYTAVASVVAYESLRGVSSGLVEDGDMVEAWAEWNEAIKELSSWDGVVFNAVAVEGVEGVDPSCEASYHRARMAEYTTPAQDEMVAREAASRCKKLMSMAMASSGEWVVSDQQKADERWAGVKQLYESWVYWELEAKRRAHDSDLEYDYIIRVRYGAKNVEFV